VERQGALSAVASLHVGTKAASTIPARPDDRASAKINRHPAKDWPPSMRPMLDQVEGFISIKRFQSLTDPRKFLSLSFFQDEAAIA
jgi:hypothetical protein